MYNNNNTRINREPNKAIDVHILLFGRTLLWLLYYYKLLLYTVIILLSLFFLWKKSEFITQHHSQRVRLNVLFSRNTPKWRKESWKPPAFACAHKKPAPSSVYLNTDGAHGLFNAILSSRSFVSSPPMFDEQYFARSVECAINALFCIQCLYPKNNRLVVIWFKS